jgi:hypothetical protein
MESEPGVEDDVNSAQGMKRQRTNADTRDETTGKQVIVGTTVGGSLNDDADAEDDRCDEHTELAPEDIGKDTVGKYTNPSTEFKD